MAVMRLQRGTRACPLYVSWLRVVKVLFPLPEHSSCLPRSQVRTRLMMLVAAHKRDYDPSMGVALLAPFSHDEVDQGLTALHTSGWICPFKVRANGRETKPSHEERKYRWASQTLCQILPPPRRNTVAAPRADAPTSELRWHCTRTRTRAVCTQRGVHAEGFLFSSSVTPLVFTPWSSLSWSSLSLSSLP